MQKRDGMNYAPVGRFRAVCAKGDFRFGVIGLDHGHINGMTNGLLEAGAEIGPVWDPDAKKVEEFCAAHPPARPARSEGEVLDADLAMIASAAVNSNRAEIGLRVTANGKDYFCDKPPFTTLEQLEEARQMVAKTNRIWAVYYSERLHVEAAVLAGTLLTRGAIGEVVQILCLAPHRLNARNRPRWFFQPESSGGILCDIGSHQVEQVLYYSGASNAEILHSTVGNYNHPEYPEFEDFGDVSLLTNNGVNGYVRVDWLTPNGLGSWGDGRVFITGTDGYLELRKYIDVARDVSGDHVYLVNHSEERLIPARGTVGYPYFGKLILDSLNRTSTAMSQDHTFKAAELALIAEQRAMRVGTHS